MQASLLSFEEERCQVETIVGNRGIRIRLHTENFRGSKKSLEQNAGQSQFVLGDLALLPDPGYLPDLHAIFRRQVQGVGF